ncbi:hypothetical protein BH11ARM2_BH11ARM2_12760 [soil metagenome]
MNKEFRPIPSSIIAEGTSFWNGAGDRGDMAMIAYGESRYALAKGDRGKTLHVWPLIEWCLEYLDRKVSPEGVFSVIPTNSKIASLPEKRIVTPPVSPTTPSSPPRR